MLDRMEDIARTGEKAQAQAMLDQLQNLFENMKSAQARREPGREAKCAEQMGELDKLMRDQQALRDDTFRRDQREQRRRAAPNGEQQQQRRRSQAGNARRRAGRSGRRSDAARRAPEGVARPLGRTAGAA